MPRRAQILPTHDFQTRWLVRFGLKLDDWPAASLRSLDERPFSDSAETHSLLTFLFADLPKLLIKRNDPQTAQLAEAFAWTCFSFWQCGSAFPAFPENYAAYLRIHLRRSPARRDPAASVLAALILHSHDSITTDGRCGLNHLKLQQPDVVRESEKLIHEGRYEDYLKAREKYDEYETALACSKEFVTDWQHIKTCFAAQFRHKKLIHRTLIPERNWVRGSGAEFDKPAKRFQAVFDLFCWKYYLWGMEGDHPHLLKPSVVFTPFGTQIFIPGYLSFDASRDLDFKKVADLHKARGITRQGPGFSVGRKELAEKKRLAKIADKEAKRRGLTGDSRYEFIGAQIGFIDHLDYRRTKKLLE